MLEHLCWLADELGESEIVCPIVDYAAQLIPQLKHKLRSSKVSKRSSYAPGFEIESSSDDSDGGDYSPSLKPSISQVVNAFSASSRSSSQSSPRGQAPGSSAPLKLNSTSVWNAVRIENAKVPAQPVSAAAMGVNQRNSVDAYTAANPAHRTKSATLAIMASNAFRNAGDSAAASRISGQVLDSMRADLSRGDGGARAAAGRKDRAKPAGLLAILAASAFRNAGDARASSRSAENALKAMKDDLAAAEGTDIELQEVHGTAAAPPPPHATEDTHNLELEVGPCVVMGVVVCAHVFAKFCRKWLVTFVSD